MKITTVAIDLGPERSGVAVLGRFHFKAKGYRHIGTDIEARTLSNTEVCNLLEGLRPRLVLVERAAGGYQQKDAERALEKVTAAVDRRHTALCVANVSTWRTE